MDTVRKLQEIKRQIEEAKSDLQQSIGRKEQLLTDLKKHGFTSIKEAKTGITRLEKTIKSKQTLLETKMMELEEAYDWDI